jgi:septal ring factor EnvC (AmiA/AmiB activator)
VYILKEKKMSDIVDRLRQHALPDPHDEREVLHAPLLSEAADEIESLSQQLAFESHKCSKCGTNLGLLHEDSCPLCNCRQQLAEANETLKDHGEIQADLCRQLAECQTDKKAFRDDLMFAELTHTECQAREKVLRDALKESYDEDGLCVDPDDFVKQDNSTALDAMLKQAKREVLNDEAAAWADIKLHAAKIGDDWLGTFADTMLAAITKELE